MAKPHLTEFLLKLATDDAFIEKYRAGSKDQRTALMEAAGLSAAQREAVLSANTRRITDAVKEELKREGAVADHNDHPIIEVSLIVQLPH
jgi:hypothetical protein